MVVSSLKRLLLGLGFVLLGFGVNAAEEEKSGAENPLLTRPALLDGPGTSRQSLREDGVDIKASWTQFGQGLVRGFGDHSFELGGKGDLVVNLDGEKLGLWSGLYLNIHQEIVAGDDALAQGDGVFIPINTAMAFPRVGNKEADTSILLTQRFSNGTTLSMGKFNMLDSAARTPLIGGGGLDTFMNTAFAAPISGVTPPYLLGASLGVNFDPVSLGVLVYDPRNAQNSDVITEPFSEGVTLSISSTLSTSLYDLPGFYSVRGVISSDESVDLRDVPQLILPPDVSEPLGTAKNPWYVSFSAQQFLWQNPDDPSKGWGLFGQVGFSDENPTPVGTSYFFGLAGNAMFEEYPNDRWGIGYFKYRFSGVLADAIAASPINYSLGPEQGVEVFYNHEFLPWLNVTADIQFLNGFPISSSNSVYTGLRTKISF
jgi:porin